MKLWVKRNSMLVALRGTEEYLEKFEVSFKMFSSQDYMQQIYSGISGRKSYSYTGRNKNTGKHI